MLPLHGIRTDASRGGRHGAPGRCMPKPWKALPSLIGQIEVSADILSPKQAIVLWFSEIQIDLLGIVDLQAV